MSEIKEQLGSVYPYTSGMDLLLQGKSHYGTAISLQSLTDKGRADNALSPPYVAGQRVSFIANVGSVLTYDDIPADGVCGTIIKVKSGGEKKTSQEGLVYVQWDDGQFRSIYAEHLRPSTSNSRRANSFVIRVADLQELGSQFETHTAADELVHKATKALWSFRQDEGSGYVIERLFDGKGEPLKV